MWHWNPFTNPIRCVEVHYVVWPTELILVTVFVGIPLSGALVQACTCVYMCFFIML